MVFFTVPPADFPAITRRGLLLLLGFVGLLSTAGAALVWSGTESQPYYQASVSPARSSQR